MGDGVPNPRGRRPKPPAGARQLTPLATAIKQAMADRKLSGRALSLAAGLASDTCRNILVSRSREPRGEAVVALAAYLGTTVEALLAGAPVPPAPDQGAPGLSQIPELLWLPDPSARPPQPAAKLRKVRGRTWSVPSDALGGRGVAGLVVYRCAEDVVGLRRGDCLVVDTSSHVPSPPGIFVTWDGYGASVARCSVVRAPGGTLMRIEGSGGVVELPLSAEVEFLGRVVARWGAI